jgi:hypothetical protein
MDQTGNTQARGADLWKYYRLAFVDFSRVARKVQSLKAKTNPNPSEIEAALLELETARLAYNHARDLLAYTLVRPAYATPGDPQRSYATRVKRIAELLWELEGRRDGRSQDHWFRAERIVQSAVSCDAASPRPALSC